MADVSPIGAIVGAGANLLGGYFARDAQRDANAQQQANFWANYRFQQDAMQHGIKWRVDDAKEAGIHPLAALGAQLTSPSPISVGSTPADGFAKGIAAAGQDISRSLYATSSVAERAEGTQALITALGLKRAQLENDLVSSQVLGSKLANLRAAQMPPGPMAAVDVPVPRPRPSDLPYADSPVPFDVPEGKKVENRPPLMLWGGRVQTSNRSSTMKDWEDMIGDDGLGHQIVQGLVMADILEWNARRMMVGSATTPRSSVREPLGGRKRR